MERIIITLPRDLLEEVDTAAHRLEQKRSRVIREALGQWLARQRKQEFEALLEEGYRSMADTLEQLAEDFSEVQAEATQTVWRWDE